jgi:hypothetical protein
MYIKIIQAMCAIGIFATQAVALDMYLTEGSAVRKSWRRLDDATRISIVPALERD